MGNNQHILIIEKDPLVCEYTAGMLNQAGYINFGIAGSEKEAAICIEMERPELVFTGDLAGTGKTLRYRFNIPFICVTQKPEKESVHADGGILPDAWLVMPFKKEDMLVAIELALFSSYRSAQKNSADCLLVKEGRYFLQIPHNNILFCKSARNYAEVHVLNGRPRLVRSVLAEIHKELPALNFIRIHRSYVVNLKHVTRIGAMHLMLGNIHLPVGRVYRPHLEDVLQSV